MSNVSWKVALPVVLACAAGTAWCLTHQDWPDAGTWGYIWGAVAGFLLGRQAVGWWAGRRRQ